MSSLLEANVSMLQNTNVRDKSIKNTRYTQTERAYLELFAHTSVAYDDCATCNNCGSGNCSSCCEEGDD